MKANWDKIASALLIIGGLNWGLIGINSGWNVVDMLLGGIPYVSRILYVLVGLSALWTLKSFKK